MLVKISKIIKSKGIKEVMYLLNFLKRLKK